MNKKTFFYVFFIFYAFYSYAQNNQQDQLSIFHTTRASGLAGAVSSVPEGIESLLYNPAGLSADLPWDSMRWTFIISGNTFFQPKYLFSVMNDVSQTGNSDGQLLVNAKDLITSSGTGSTFTLSTACTGKNWGSGFFLSGAFFLDGKPFPLGTEGYIQFELNVPIAFSMALYKTSSFSLDAGIVLRPGITLYKNLNGSDVDSIIGGTQTFRSLISDTVKQPYFSLPADTGVILTFFDKPYDKAQIRFSCVTKNLFGDYIIPGSAIKPLPYPVSLRTGGAILLPFRLFGVKFYTLFSAELQNVNFLAAGTISIWDSLCLGLEFSVAKILRFQMGLTSGYPCIAARLSVFWASLAFSWQTVETGNNLNDNPLSVFRVSLLFNPDK
ncbi:MAG: hypothetical protein IKZ04_02700 [Spirochaetaceae bacterium]|nr:hypothetical protein [Spirochaetaceae bacterium]